MSSCQSLLGNEYYLSFLIFVAAGTPTSESLLSKWTSTSVRCYSGFQAVLTEPLPSKWSYSSQYFFKPPMVAFNRLLVLQPKK
jgi:hypothetical protein